MSNMRREPVRYDVLCVRVMMSWGNPYDFGDIWLEYCGC